MPFEPCAWLPCRVVLIPKNQGLSQSGRHHDCRPNVGAAQRFAPMGALAQTNGAVIPHRGKRGSRARADGLLSRLPPRLA